MDQNIVVLGREGAREKIRCKPKDLRREWREVQLWGE